MKEPVGTVPARGKQEETHGTPPRRLPHRRIRRNRADLDCRVICDLLGFYEESCKAVRRRLGGVAR